MPHHRMPGLPDYSVTCPVEPDNGILLRKYSDEIVQDSDLLPFYPQRCMKNTAGGTVCCFIQFCS